jgi:Domain of unknown function (DUF4249)
MKQAGTNMRQGGWGGLLFALAFGVLVASCTKDLTSSLPNYGTSIVVDGNIETNKPPVIILTRSTKVFGDLNVNDISSFMLHGANIYMTMDSSNVQVPLQEICLQSLAIPDSQKLALLQSLGVLVYDSSKVPDVCAYTLPLSELATYSSTGTCPDCGVEGHKYNLHISYNGKTITSYTTIPHATGIVGLSIRNVPNVDSLVNVEATINVPATDGSFIRYWTKRNSEPFYTSLTGSVYDNLILAGQTVTLPVQRGEPSYITNPDPNTFGYFWKGDTVTVKWASIDSRTFDFFNTLENDGGGSPFSSYIRVKSNVEGDSAIGIWAGYGARYYTIIVPR